MIVKSVQYIKWATSRKWTQKNPTTGIWERPSGKRKDHRPAIAHDVDYKQPKSPQNAHSLTETTARQTAQRILAIQKEAINQIRTGFLRGQNNSPKELEENCHQPHT